MSFARVVKVADTLADASRAAKVASAFKTANMIAKGAWAIMDVSSLGMDIYMFADSLDSELNPNHDPAMKQLITDVTNLGVQYDGLLTQTADANDKINNLLAGLTGLHNIYQDFVAKEGIAFKQLQKLETLANKLMKSSPTAYRWFNNKFIQDAKLKDKDADEKLKRLQDNMQVGGLSLGLSGLGVLVSGYMGVSSVKAAVVGYQDWKKRNQPAAGGDTATLPGDGTRPRSHSEGDVSSSSGKKTNTGFDDVLLRPAKNAGDGSYQPAQNRSKTLSRGKTIGKALVKGVGVLITVGGFGMNIYVLVQRKRQRDQDIATLTTMKTDYERNVQIYTGVLKGCGLKDKDGNIQKDKENKEFLVDQAMMKIVAKFFFPDTFPDPSKAGSDYDNQVNAFLEALEGKDALIKGYEGVKKDYDTQVDDFLNEMDGVYSETIQRFKANRVDASEDAVIDRLERSQKRFQTSMANGKNETIDSATRKAALDKMAEEFTISIAQEMNEINRALDKVIADHIALSMLEPTAKDIINTAKMFNAPINDQLITMKAESSLQTLNTGYPDRTQFKTVSEVVEGLKVLIPELQRTNA